MEFAEPEGEVGLTGTEDIPPEAVKSMRIKVEDLASGQFVYVPAQDLTNRLEVLASCDVVKNRHIPVSVSNPNSLPAEVNFSNPG
jgi:hypothetical protein